MPDRECEDSLRDSSGESGGCFGEVVFEPHLAFEVRKNRADHQPGRGERRFAAGVGRSKLGTVGESHPTEIKPTG